MACRVSEKAPEMMACDAMDNTVRGIEQPGVAGRTGEILEQRRELIKWSLLDEALTIIEHDPLFCDWDGICFCAEGKRHASPHLHDTEVEVLVDSVMKIRYPLPVIVVPPPAGNPNPNPNPPPPAKSG